MEFIKLCCKYLTSLFLHIFWIFPVKSSRIFLLNDLSHTYGGSPKSICEYLVRHTPGRYQIVYSLKTLDADVPKEVTVVRPRSAQYFYYALTSQVIVTNCGGISYLPVRKTQMVLNTWHGGGAYKKNGLNAYHGLAYRFETRLNAKKTSYLMASNRIIQEEFQKALLLSEEKILRSGIPRIDLFFTDYGPIRAKVYRHYGIDNKKHIVLYCPTFRSGENALRAFYLPKRQEIDVPALLAACKNRFGGEWVLAVRLHPRLQEQKALYPGSVLDFSAYPDAQELLCAADAVISDYSGLIWDYSFTGKPCFLYADDVEKYRQSPGFYVPIEAWPYPLAGDFKTLLTNITEFDAEKYSRDRLKHYRDVGSYETGTATKTACHMMYDFCFSASRVHSQV